VAVLRAVPAHELPVDEVVLDLLATAEHLREIRIVNRLVPRPLPERSTAGRSAP
jgi:hypothetical protein